MVTSTNMYGCLSCISQHLAQNGCIECVECVECVGCNVGGKAVYQFIEYDITLIVHNHGTVGAWKVCCLLIMLHTCCLTHYSKDTHTFHREYAWDT